MVTAALNRYVTGCEGKKKEKKTKKMRKKETDGECVMINGLGGVAQSVARLGQLSRQPSKGREGKGRSSNGRHSGSSGTRKNR